MLRLAVYNIGHGSGTSIGEVLRAVEEATGVKVPIVTAPRRPDGLGR